MSRTRKPLSKKVRFEVFKRDSFKCQYCGRSAPDVILHVDHIDPVSRGGPNDIINLITSCFDCNQGKKDRKLDDNSAIAKQKAQLDQLQERREQLEMMIAWSSSLQDIKDEAAERLCDVWQNEILGGRWSLNENGKDQLRQWLRKQDVEKIISAMYVARDQYFKRGADGELTVESVNVAWSKVPGIATLSSKPESERMLYYARGIIRKRMYCDERVCWNLLRSAHNLGVDPEELISIARNARNWTDWRVEMCDILDAYEGASKHGEN